MDPEHDPMLMEALMLFSSEGSESDGAGVDAEREPVISSDVPTQATAIARVEDSSLKAPSSKSKSKTPTRQTTVSIAPKRRRKRLSKCTYVARREEVAQLRTLVVQLEAQLLGAQEEHHRRQQLARQIAQHEHELMIQSQNENNRLRSLLATSEARIRSMQDHQENVEP